MKNYLLYIAFAFGFSAIYAQDFQETKNYITKTEIPTKEPEHEKTMIHVLVAEDTSKKVATLSISDIFHDMRISILTEPALRDIREVLKVEFEYNGYSLAIDTYYFLVTEKGEYIALPKITKIYDDITEPIVDYVFPTQKNGKEETVLKAIFHYNENYTVEEIEVLQSFVWNDDDFDHEVAVSGIQ